jgi:hypothetical protein
MTSAYVHIIQSILRGYNRHSSNESLYVLTVKDLFNKIMRSYGS